MTAVMDLYDISKPAGNNLLRDRNQVIENFFVASVSLRAAVIEQHPEMTVVQRSQLNAIAYIACMIREMSRTSMSQPSTIGQWAAQCFPEMNQTVE